MSEAQPCPGRRSPVRPTSMVPVCRGCPLLDRFSDLGDHQAPVAYHDGQRWHCERRAAMDTCGSPLVATAAVAAAQ